MKRRAMYGVLLAATVAAGLLSRRLGTGVYFFDKSLGDVLYAVGVYFVLRVAWPRWSAVGAGVTAVAICLAVEGFKFTGLPAEWRGSTVSRVVLGTTPSWHNVACYLLGVGLVAAGEVALGRRCR